MSLSVLAPLREFLRSSTGRLVLGFLVLRILLSAISYGTNDISSWQRFALAINVDGMAALYHQNPLFNHPPLAGWFAAKIYNISLITDISFPFLFRLPGILADCGLALLIWWLLIGSQKLPPKPRREAAIVILASSPIAILISGYHGNTDPIYAAVMVASLAALAHWRAPFLSGTLLGLAANVKLIPILILPLLIARCETKRGRFLLLSGFIPWCLPYLLAWSAIGDDFIRNVFAYGSQLDYWGIPGLLMLAAGNDLALAQGLATSFAPLGKLLIIISAIAVAVYAVHHPMGERRSLYLLAALVFSLFAVLAPGFGVQYLVIFPGLLALSWPAWSLRISIVSGLLALCSYLHFLISWYPIRSLHNATADRGAVFIAFVLWLAFVVFLLEAVTGRAVLLQSEDLEELSPSDFHTRQARHTPLAPESPEQTSPPA